MTDRFSDSIGNEAWEQSLTELDKKKYGKLFGEALQEMMDECIDESVENYTSLNAKYEQMKDELKNNEKYIEAKATIAALNAGLRELTYISRAKAKFYMKRLMIARRRQAKLNEAKGYNPYTSGLQEGESVTFTMSDGKSATFNK